MLYGKTVANVPSLIHPDSIQTISWYILVLTQTKSNHVRIRGNADSGSAAASGVFGC